MFEVRTVGVDLAKNVIQIHGVDPDGKSLWIMPSAAYTHLSPSDLSSLIAFLKQTPPVERALPPKSFGPIGRMLIANGSLKPSAAKVNHDTPFRAAPPAGPSARYGAYVVNVCRYCHGAQLNGGLIQGPPGAPPSANLTRSDEGIPNSPRKRCSSCLSN